MAFVIDDFEILEAVIENVLRLPLDQQPGQRMGRSAQLLVCLVKVIQIQVAVTAGLDEIANLEPGLLCNHVGQQGIRGDVERHAEKNIRAALI